MMQKCPLVDFVNPGLGYKVMSASDCGASRMPYELISSGLVGNTCESDFLT